MTREIKDMQYRLKQLLRDKNTTKEEKEKIKITFNKMIKDRMEQLQEYKKESLVPEELATQNN